MAAPALLVPNPSGGSSEVIALVALCFAAFVFIEYVSTYPSLLEFRGAPPFNRMRFASLVLTVMWATVICRGLVAPNPLSQLAEAAGGFLGSWLDFPYSPIRLFTLMLGRGGDPEYAQLVLALAGMAYTVSIFTLIWFFSLLYFTRWPSNRGPFNVWINLPTFDPTAGGDVVTQLEKDARVNCSLGFLLPFLIPLAVYLISVIYKPIAIVTPQSLIWTVTAWSVLSTNMLMRGIAMARIASMIQASRRKTAVDDDAYMPA